MKKQNLDGKKLGLSRETLIPLQQDELELVAGGQVMASRSWIPTSCLSENVGQTGKCQISIFRC